MVLPDAALWEQIRSDVSALGVDRPRDLDALASFACGPPVVAVAALSATDRATTTEALKRALPDLTVVELDPTAPAALRLWDLTVVATPAQRALSRVEEALIAELVADRHPVLVAVTGVTRFGSEAMQLSARGELEQYRLGPLLRHRRVRWHFVDLDADLAAFQDEVAAVVATTQPHHRAARSALHDFLAEVTDPVQDLLESRRGELGRLSGVRAQVPAQDAHLRETLTTAALAGKERMRTAEDRLTSEFAVALGAVFTWVEFNGEGPYPDHGDRVRSAWMALLDRANGLGAYCAATVRQEARRVETTVADALARLGPGEPSAAAPETNWESDRLSAALDRLAQADPGEVLNRLEERARHAVAEARERGASAPHPAPRPAIGTVKGDAATPAGQPTKAVKGGVRQSARGMLHLAGERARGSAALAVDLLQLAFDDLGPETDLQASLLSDIQMNIGSRVRDVVDAIAEVVETQGTSTVEGAVARARGLVAAAEKSVDSRYGWFDAYNRLLAVQGTL